MANPKGINQYTRSGAKKALFTPDPNKYHVFRKQMAANIREARSTGLRGKDAVAWATSHSFTNVKGAQFVDQGLKGKVWRNGKWVKT